MDDSHDRSKAGLLVLALVMLLVAGISLAFLVREHHVTRDLSTARDSTNRQLTQARAQINALSERLEALKPAPVAAPVRAKPSPAPGARPAVGPKRSAPAPNRPPLPAEDKRLGQMQAQLAVEEKELAGNREEVQRTREELQNRLSSTRGELKQSIAKTHEEVVALQKRGEVNVYEFRLTKSKKLERVGPIQIRLRKVNNKHKYYDLSLILDDVRLDKKHVNLFEPVWINLADRPRPLALVVNQVNKNTVAGYLTEPKYKTQELAAGFSAGDRPRLPEAHPEP